MTVVEHKYHQIQSNDENLEPGRHYCWSKIGASVVGASCLLVCTIMVVSPGATHIKTGEEKLPATANANQNPSMRLYFNGPLQFVPGQLQSSALPGSYSSRLGPLQFLPGTLRSWLRSPGHFQSESGPLQSQPGHIQYQSGSVQSQIVPLKSSSPGSLQSRLAPLQASTGKEGGGHVVVVGAGGRTGRLVLEQLLTTGRKAIGLVRSKAKADKLAESMSNSLIMPGDTGAPVSPETCSESVAVADIMDASSLDTQFSGAAAVVVCSSATPKIKKRSILPFLLKRIVTLGKQGRPSFRFPPQGTPEEVDYLGVQNIIQAAKKAGVQRVVVVGSMGGAQKENFLNTIGEGKDGSQGNILVWKRKAEMELINSGLEYTIIHPGGLLDKPGGQRELIVGIDDEILKTTRRSVPRADVAAMAVNCIDCPEAKNRAFDMASIPEDEGSGATKDLCVLVGSLGKKTCDYSKNVPP